MFQLAKSARIKRLMIVLMRITEVISYGKNIYIVFNLYLYYDCISNMNMYIGYADRQICGISCLSSIIGYLADFHHEKCLSKG